MCANDPCVQVVYGKSSMAKFNEVGCTNVLYHEKKPHFYDEV
jgi:hypothetical protein